MRRARALTVGIVVRDCKNLTGDGGGNARDMWDRSEQRFPVQGPAVMSLAAALARRVAVALAVLAATSGAADPCKFASDTVEYDLCAAQRMRGQSCGRGAVCASQRSGDILGSVACLWMVPRR